MSAYNNYSGYGYGYPYGSYYQQPAQMQAQPNYNMGNMMNPQPQAQQPTQPQAPQTSYLPLTYVSGLIGAKSFIVAPNQTIYLRDSDEGSDLLFEKSADMYGKYTLTPYRMVRVNLDDNGKQVQEKQKQAPTNDINLDMFATKKDLDDFKTLFEAKMNDLSAFLQKAYKPVKTNTNVKDSGRNE